MEFVTDKVVQHFHENGFCVIPKFLTPNEIQALKTATDQVVEKYCQNPPTYNKSRAADSTYFAESGDKIRGFYEEGLFDAEGNLTIPKHSDGLNKIGQALHKFVPAFRTITFSPKVNLVLEEITKMEDPTIVQSIVIFKNAKVGGAVIPHQDSTYHHTEPTPGTLLSFWIALDDACVENGCVHFYAGSHMEGKVYKRFIANPVKSSETMFVHTDQELPDLSGFELVPVPCKAGDLILIDGLVFHQSAPNTSNANRLAYLFTVYDASVQWSTQNWLQPTQENTFEKLKNMQPKK